ncbi:MAG: ATP-binding cassette domain-containing protein [Sphaerospermopsis sp. SIO1G1]|nr:ATP-binding cassette domain-containing protein [Sphaerospermopsis sp. SIO1G1]
MLKLEEINLYARLKNNSPGYPILQDISFQVLPGDRITIVGHNGAGKTSLLRLINRLSEPTSGKMYLENEEYQQIPIIQLRRQIILVQQESKLLGMTVREALAYPLLLQGLSKSEIQERVSYWSEQLQIPDEWLGHTEVQLSAGQKQLVAIARALVIQPKILLLDEPIFTLDPGKASLVINVITKLTQDSSGPFQTAVLMVNHQLDLAQEFSNRLLHLQQGKISVNSPTSQINWEELKTNLISAQKQVDEDW